MASPKHPQSETGLVLRIRNVIEVKKIIYRKEIKEVTDIRVLHINDIPMINSVPDNKIDNTIAKGIKNSIPHALK